MPIIEVRGLTKTYRVFQKNPGLRGALRGLFRRQYKEVHAVADVSFPSNPARWSHSSAPTGPARRPPSRCSPA